MLALVPYIQARNRGIWICPDDPEFDATIHGYDWGEDYTSYWGNPHFFGDYPFENNPKGCHTPPRLDSSVKQPSSTIMFTEGLSYEFNEGTMAGGFLLDHLQRMNAARHSAGSANYPAFPFTGLWHNNRSNYLFADGHVKVLSIRQTLVPTVLWDNVSDWCDGCEDECSPDFGFAQSDWTPDRVQDVLQYLNQVRYP